MRVWVRNKINMRNVCRERNSRKFVKYKNMNFSSSDKRGNVEKQAWVLGKRHFACLISRHLAISQSFLSVTTWPGDAYFALLNGHPSGTLHCWDVSGSETSSCFRFVMYSAMSASICPLRISRNDSTIRVLPPLVLTCGVEREKEEARFVLQIYLIDVPVAETPDKSVAGDNASTIIYSISVPIVNV